VMPWVLIAGAIVAAGALVAAVVAGGLPWWYSRAAWAVRRKVMVRVHIDAPDGVPQTLEGIRIGVVGGQLLLAQAKALEAPGRTHALDGITEVPTARVLFVQRLVAVAA